MPDDDRSLKEALEDLAPPAGQNGVWEYLQTEVATRRRRRRRVVLATATSAVALACGGAAVFAALHWWPERSDMPLVDDGTMGGPAGQTSQPADTAGVWQEIPLPRSEDVYCHTLAMDPEDPAVLYAGTEQGLLISRDGGATWSQQWAGEDVSSVVVDPRPPVAVYVQAPDQAGGDGLFRSLDRGATWTQIIEGGQSLVRELWIDTSVSPPALYVAVSDPPYGVLRSTDGGATWQGVAVPEDVQLIGAAGATIYAQRYAEVGPGFVRSADGGATWQDVETPPPHSPDSIYTLMRLDPVDPARVYLYDTGLDPSVDAPKLKITAYVSTDGALTWSQLSGEELEWAKAVATAAPQTPEAAIRGAAGFLAGYLESEWDVITRIGATPTRSSPPEVGFVVHPTDPDVLLVATDRGIYRSTDGGATWAETTAALTTGISVSMLTVDPHRSDTLYVETDGTILRTADSGFSWAPLFDDGSAWSLSLAPSDPSILYVCSDAGLRRSEDGGATWMVTTGAGLADAGSGWALPQGVFVSSESPLTILGYSFGGLYRSTDGGESWTKPTGAPDLTIENIYPTGLYSDHVPVFEDGTDPSTLYTVAYAAGVELAGGDAPRSIDAATYLSTDGGETWAELATLDAGDGRCYLPLAFDAHEGPTIYAQRVLPQVYDDGGDGAGGVGYSSDNSIWRSSDGGRHWEETGRGGLDWVHSIVVDPWSDGALYTISDDWDAGSGDLRQSVYRSTDGGDSWEKVCDGPALPAITGGSAGADDYLQSLTVAPGGLLYVRTERSVFRWTPAGEVPGLPPPATTATADPFSPLSLEDGSWQLRVDRALEPSVALGGGDIESLFSFLPEADYRSVEDGGILRLTVADQGARITVEDALGEESSLITAVFASVSDGRLCYDLPDAFAGGRLVVWQDGDGLQAEFTVYGSGLPILRSVRGALTRQ